MNEANTLISGIEYKVRKLIMELRDLKEINNNLIQIIEKQKTELTNKDDKLKLSEKRNQITGLTNIINQDKGKDEIKTRLNDLVREIDKCMSLMNTK